MCRGKESLLKLERGSNTFSSLEDETVTYR